MSLPNPGMDFTPFDTLPASALDNLVENIESLANGTGQEDASLVPEKLTNPYVFSVYRGSPHNSSNVFAKVPFDTELYDPDADVASGTYTVPIDGIYHFSALAGNTAAGTTAIETVLYKNGAVIKEGTYAGTNTSGGAFSHVSGDIALEAGDTIEVYFLGGSGSTMTTGAASCYFDGHLVSAT